MLVVLFAPYAYDYALFFGACATMLKNFRGLFSRDLSIDLETNTLIYIREQGIVLDEPSVVALRQQGNQRSVAAVGLDAKRMLGRTPGNITAIRPQRWGDRGFFGHRKMLTYFIAKVHENSFIRPSPRVLICVPCKSTEVERRAIEKRSVGGRQRCSFSGRIMAAAIGAGLPVHEAVGTVVDIGGGTTEIAIISLNGVVFPTGSGRRRPF